MTIKSKTFYACDNYMNIIRGKSDSGARLEMTSNKEGICTNEITISWKEDRKAEVTESQIDELFADITQRDHSFDILRYIKQEIFKDVK